MIADSPLLPTLRRRIARIAGDARGVAGAAVALGHGGIDRLLGGGLARGRLHELFAAEDEEAASAAGFAAMLALRMGGRGAPMLWLRTEAAERRGGRLHAAGLGEIGIDPAALLLGVVPDEPALLRSACDAARCAGLAALVIELWGDSRLLDLTASRRLMLAAERSGVTALVLRVAAAPTPSAAETRWSIAAAPSAPLEADAPGPPRFDVELLRRRSGPAGMRWRVEWDRETLAFRAPLSGAVLPVAGDRAAAQLPGAPVRRAS